MRLPIQVPEALAPQPAHGARANTTQDMSSATELRNKQGIADYTKYWNPDSTKDTDKDQSARLDQYTDVVNAYYDGATDLYEYGWGLNFHFARYYPGAVSYTHLTLPTKA